MRNLRIEEFPDIALKIYCLITNFNNLFRDIKEEINEVI